MTAERHSVLEHTADALRTSPLLRLVAMGALTLLLLLPIEWISALITERMLRRAEAIAEVSGKWGRTQTVLGPVLSVPYEHRWVEQRAKGPSITKSEKRLLTMIPQRLDVRARIQSEERSRGIFTVPVYRVALDINGTFDAPKSADLGIEADLIDWQRATLAIGVSDVRTIHSRGVTWNGAEQAFQPGPGPVDIESGIHAAIASPFVTAQPTFTLQLDINGSSGLYFTPAGQETSVAATSNWPSPSFQGSWLPNTRSVGADGFESTWQIPLLGRNQTAAWTETSKPIRDMENKYFGVELVTPVDAHRMTERSVKYARLFIVLTFATIWLIEVLSGVRVHPIQYLMVGCALCTFYLLELSLSEQIGFARAYLMAAGAVALLIAAYATAVLHGRQRAAIVAATVGSLYGYLYVVLTNEDYALLLGSLVLFAALAITMLTTRRIDWYRRVEALKPQHETQPASS